MFRVMVKKNATDPLFGFGIKETVKTMDLTTLDEALFVADCWFEERLGETVTVSELQPNGKAPISRYMRALWAEGEGH